MSGSWSRVQLHDHADTNRAIIITQAMYAATVQPSPPPLTSNFHHSFLLSLASFPRWHHSLHFEATTNCLFKQALALNDSLAVAIHIRSVMLVYDCVPSPSGLRYLFRIIW